MIRSDNHVEIRLVGNEGSVSAVTRRNQKLDFEVNGGITVPLSVQKVPPLEIIDSIGFVYVPLFRNRPFLHQKYVVEGLSLAQISEQICSSKEAVRKALERFGIPVREAHKPHGHPSQPRYGQKIRNGRVEAFKTEQRVVDAINELKTQGLSLRQIAQTMTRLKIPTKCNGQSWHPQMIKRVLDSRSR